MHNRIESHLILRHVTRDLRLDTIPVPAVTQTVSDRIKQELLTIIPKGVLSPSTSNYGGYSPAYLYCSDEKVRSHGEGQRAGGLMLDEFWRVIDSFNNQGGVIAARINTLNDRSTSLVNVNPEGNIVCDQTLPPDIWREPRGNLNTGPGVLGLYAYMAQHGCIQSQRDESLRILVNKVVLTDRGRTAAMNGTAQQRDEEIVRYFDEFSSKVPGK